MSIFIINPGSGPVRGATHDNAAENITEFTIDLGRRFGYRNFQVTDLGREEDGRWSFEVTADGRKHDVDMPGLPLRQVNYGADPADDIWDFPRLYVDGCSWVWTFALNQFEDEDDV